MSLTIVHHVLLPVSGLLDTGDQQPTTLALAWTSLYLSSVFLFSGCHGFFVAQPHLPQHAAVTSATVPVHRDPNAGTRHQGWVGPIATPFLHRI